MKTDFTQLIIATQNVFIDLSIFSLIIIMHLLHARHAGPTLLRELSVMMEMFYIYTVQYSNRLPHVAIEHLRCGSCN